jgi:hypothetical protein
MQLTLCRHVKTNGTRCKAPSLTGGTWCYFHHRLHQRHTAFRSTAATRGYLIPGQHIELNVLEDRESVQVALSVVINALATGQLDIKRATALLYGLQLASNNAASLQTRPYAPDIVRAVEPSPEGLDLAEPGATLDTEDLYHFSDEERRAGRRRRRRIHRRTNQPLPRPFQRRPLPQATAASQQQSGNPCHP